MATGWDLDEATRALVCAMIGDQFFKQIDARADYDESGAGDCWYEASPAERTEAAMVVYTRIMHVVGQLALYDITNEASEYVQENEGE